MWRSLTIPALCLALLAGAGVARADEDDCLVPMAQWQPRDAVARLAEDKGWAVRRIRIDDGCYEVIGRDADGRDIEVKVHPATLEVLQIEIEDGHDDDQEDGEGRGNDD